MPPEDQLRLLCCAKAAYQVRDADVFLHRSHAWYSSLFRASGRSEYSHASLAAHWHGRIHCLQAVWGGDPKPLLSRMVALAPGQIDVYRCNRLSTADREIIAADMIEVVGRGYSWQGILRASLSHLPIVRLFVAIDSDDRVGATPNAFCSHAVAHCYARLGHDLVPNLADRLTEPGDLAHSALLQYQFTLTA
jgi:hypothetical protein